MSIRKMINTWFAGVMHRRHVRRRDQMLRMVEVLAEAGAFDMAARTQASADIEDAYAARWLART